MEGRMQPERRIQSAGFQEGVVQCARDRQNALGPRAPVGWDHAGGPMEEAGCFRTCCCRVCRNSSDTLLTWHLLHLFLFFHLFLHCCLVTGITEMFLSASTSLKVTFLHIDLTLMGFCQVKSCQLVSQPTDCHGWCHPQGRPWGSRFGFPEGFMLMVTRPRADTTFTSETPGII